MPLNQPTNVTLSILTQYIHPEELSVNNNSCKYLFPFQFAQMPSGKHVTIYSPHSYE